MPWAVLNVDGRDSFQDFAQEGIQPDLSGHPPVNYHAYAACTGGSFHKSVSSVPADCRQVLVLLRQRNLAAARSAVRQLRERGVSVWVSLKESGGLQVAELLADSRRWRDLCEICDAATGVLSSTPDLVSLYRSCGAQRAEFVPTPYPVDVSSWDFGRPVAERNGIFVGTREFDVFSRRHAAAMAAACAVAVRRACRVVVLNPDGRRGNKLLDGIRESAGIGNAMEVVQGRLSYPDYLRLMASCRVVWQLDRSRVPGQVAGDALLCRLPCVGGDGAVDHLGHPLTHGDGKTDEELAMILEQLLVDDGKYQGAVASSQAAALDQLSFKSVATRLNDLCRIS